MAEKQYNVKDSNGTYHEVRVEDNDSGWSTFWKWFARILIAIIVAGVVIYAVDAWVFTSSNEADQASDEPTGAQLDINLNATTDGADTGDTATQ